MLRSPDDRVPLDRIALQLDPLTAAESDRVRDMLADLGCCTWCGAWPPCEDRPARRPRRRLRIALGIVAALLALVALLACGNGAGKDPGRPKCVDAKGQATTCPEEWRER